MHSVVPVVRAVVASAGRTRSDHPADPAFVFHAENLAAGLGVPRQAVDVELRRFVEAGRLAPVTFGEAVYRIR